MKIVVIDLLEIVLRRLERHAYHLYVIGKHPIKNSKIIVHIFHSYLVKM
jgi:hypothetical protein